MSENSDRLRADYKAAFDQWAKQVSRLQKIATSSRDTSIAQEAEARVSAAELDYRRSRDKLIEEMVADCGETAHSR